VGVVLVGLAASVGDDRVEASAERRLARRLRLGVEAKPHDAGAAAGDVEDIARTGLGARLEGVHRGGQALDDVAVERVLHVRRGVRRAPEPLEVGLVLGEEPLDGAGGARLDLEAISTERRVPRRDDAVAGALDRRLLPVTLAGSAP